MHAVITYEGGQTEDTFLRDQLGIFENTFSSYSLVCDGYVIETSCNSFDYLYSFTTKYELREVKFDVFSIIACNN